MYSISFFLIYLLHLPWRKPACMPPYAIPIPVTMATRNPSDISRGRLARLPMIHAARLFRFRSRSDRRLVVGCSGCRCCPLVVRDRRYRHFALMICRLAEQGHPGKAEHLHLKCGKRSHKFICTTRSVYWRPPSRKRLHGKIAIAVKAPL